MIDEMVAAFVLTLARVGTFINVLPLLGGANTPPTVKVGFSLALAALFYTESSDRLLQDPHALAGLTTWVGMGLAVGREMILGSVLGFAMGLFLAPAHVAADFITQEIGLSIANVLTASGDTSSNSLTVVFEMLASVVFLALDLHHVFLLVLQETFQFTPIGQGLRLPNWDLIEAASVSQEGGLLLAMPVVLCLFLTTIILALMSRAAPQLSLYTVGFPLKVFVGLGALIVLLPQLIAGLMSQFGFFLEILQLR